jgi:hypothetical protein
VNVSPRDEPEYNAAYTLLVVAEQLALKTTEESELQPLHSLYELVEDSVERVKDARERREEEPAHA